MVASAASLGGTRRARNAFRSMDWRSSALDELRHHDVIGPVAREGVSKPGGELPVEDGDEDGPVPAQEAVEVGRRHARREALAQDGGDAVDEDFGGRLHEDSEGVVALG